MSDDFASHYAEMRAALLKLGHARDIEVCRLFLTTKMTQGEVGKRFGISPTQTGMILFHYGIPGRRSGFAAWISEERGGYQFGKRRHLLPPDLQAKIEELKRATLSPHKPANSP
jgi:hypothetical protein